MASAAPPGIPPALLAGIGAHRIVNTAWVAACAVVTYDFFLTFPQEVEHFWPAAISIPKVLFMVLRYYSFAHMGIVFQYFVNTHNDAAGCGVTFNRLGYSSVVSHMLCDAVGFVRVYGFSGRNRILGAFLSIFFCATASLELYFMWRFTETIRFLEHRRGGIGCLPIAGQNMLLTIVFIFGLVNLVVLTFIMIWVAYTRRQHMQGFGGLIQLFYRDGIFYFIALSVLAILNIMFGHTGARGPPSSIFVQIQIYLNNVLTQRMLLHLRSWSKRTVQSSMPTREDFRSTALGEMVFSGSQTLVDSHNSKTIQLSRLRTGGTSTNHTGSAWSSEPK